MGGCFFKSFGLVREGQAVSFSADTIGCGGGKLYTGFAPMPPHVPAFVSEKERYKATPADVLDTIKRLDIRPMTGKFLNFVRIDKVDSLEKAEGLLFFATPDVLSGLAAWACYDNNSDDAVSCIFGSGCSSVVSQAVKENRLGDIFRDSYLPSSDDSNSFLQTSYGDNRLDAAQARLQNNAPHIYAYSVAKPFGSLSVNNELQPPHLSGIVLPVFTNSAIIPTSLEDPGRNPLADYLWFEFLVEYLPTLGTVGSLDEIPQAMQNKYSFYHSMLQRLSNPEWREQGITWLETPVREPDPDKPDEVIPTNEDNCNPPGTVHYPPILH